MSIDTPQRSRAEQFLSPEFVTVTPQMRRYRRGDSLSRAVYLLFGVLIVLSIYAGRVFDLMVVKGDSLAQKGQNQRIRTYALPADRGTIYDSQGAPLAISVESRNLTADQRLITDPHKAAERLAPMISADVTQLEKKLTGDDRFVYLAKGLTPEKWRQIKALNIQGLFSEKTTARTYPGGSLAANVLGFVNSKGVGSGGIEMSLDKVLHGTDGKHSYETGAKGEAIPTADQVLEEPVAGRGVQLTINRDIQYVAQRAIAERVKIADADSGTVIVEEVKTGRILAMATAPTFNPNNVGQEDKANLGNRAVTEIYEPGSTGKVVTLSAVLNEGKAEPTTPMSVPGTLTRAGHTTHDHVDHGTLRLTLNGVLAESSNIGTILFADKIGGDTLYKYQRKFGLGQRTGLGFPGEEPGLLPSPDKWWGTTFQALAYGQSYSLTSLQVANTYATIANGGVRPVPRLVDGFVNADGSFEPAQTTAGTRVVSKKTAKTMAQMLENVVTEGTGKPAAIPGYRVAGKTGTAERAVNGGYSGYSASFIGFAPADDPAVVVQVVLQNPKAGHYGGMHGGPVFKTVMTTALQELKIAPSGTESPVIATTW
ncbi:MAG: peptidoglycan D,D-transpeptidase FtsI family protein [Candidatus Nanopelagicales bacterium]